MGKTKVWVALGTALGIAAVGGTAAADGDRPARAAGADITDWRLSSTGWDRCEWA